jgi:tetratricopeptide (TPR) repeat protein
MLSPQKSFDLPDGPWLDRLNPAFLAARYPSWAGLATGFEQAAEAFRRHGLRTLAPLDEALHFEPDYFREANPAWEGCDDVTCYRDWLMQGLAAGQFPSAAAHLQHLGLPLLSYPQGFAWRYYARLRPQAGAHRWAALEDFCRHGLAVLDEALPFGPDAGTLLYALGSKFSMKNDTLAVRAYELARSAARLPPAEQQHLADAYLRLGLYRPALELYGGLISDGHATGWTIRNLVKCAIRLEAWPALRDALDRTHRSHAADRLWGVTIGEAVEGLFAGNARAARTLMADGDYRQADRMLAETVAELATLVETHHPSTRAAGARRHLFILANMDEADGVERRVHERARLLDLLEVPHEICPLAAADRYRTVPPDAAAIILFRVPALPAVICLVMSARRLGVPVFFESDVALVDRPIEQFRGKITASLYDGFRFGVPLQAAAARLCDFAIAPTEPLAGAMQKLVRRRRVFVVPDSLLPKPAEPPPSAGTARLFLHTAALSFIDAPPDDFGAALLAAFRHWPGFILHLSGPVHLATCFDAHSRRIVHAGAGRRPQDHWPDLAASDLNLVVPGEAEHALLSWCEAAACAVPSLLLMPHNRLPEIRDDANALVAATPEQWLAALDRLFAEPDLRRRLGTQAQRDVALRCDTDAALRALDRLLSEATSLRGASVRFA